MQVSVAQLAVGRSEPQDESMAQLRVDFNAPDLSAQVVKLASADIDRLTFGAIQIGLDGTIRFVNALEVEKCGQPTSPAGKNLYEACPIFSQDFFRERLQSAIAQGPVDLEFGWAGDHDHSPRGLRIRVQSAKDNGVWIFIERDEA